MSFAQLKKNRKEISKNLAAKVQNMGQRRSFDKEGFWRPTTGKDGNGWAIIRFLPAGGNEETPYVEMQSYSFQGPTGLYYIEKSRVSIAPDEPDPCAEFVGGLWAKDKELAKKYPRSKKFISNILVVNDPEHPENNGKVFLYEYGKQIADKIKDSMVPKIPTDESVDPFDMWEGANLKLIVGRKDKYPTYETSSFAAPAPVAKTDKELEAIYNQCKPLQALIAPDQFKSYDELKKKLDRVLGGKTTSAPKAEATESPFKEESELSSTEAESLEDILDGIDVDEDK